MTPSHGGKLCAFWYKGFPMDEVPSPLSDPQGPGFEGVVVALGASAGGLEALDRFFGSLPPVDSAAFVVIQHLAPEHKTMMDTLLARHTAMPVAVAEDGMPLQGGHIYVLPPNAAMTVTDGCLRLAPRPASGLSLPIDTFFDSLATAAPMRAVGIVLSGTGGDGSKGVRKLAEAGAWILVQDPATCRFDGMPRNAIASGATDHVLSPEGLAQEVLAITRSGAVARPRGAADGPYLASSGHADPALRMLERAMRIDFGQYKPATLLRRLERRMNATGFERVEAYADHLAATPEELVALRHEVLIPVTSFFRDTAAFKSLSETALAPLVAARAGAPDEPIRVWVTACSTGEEAYSIAMVLADLMHDAGHDPNVKIFATDVEPDYIARAAAGRYSAAQVAAISEDIRARWFEQRDDGSWQVRTRLRQLVVFSRHDLLADAPFTRMDLVCCRNMLIYLRPMAQQGVLRRLTYALREGGVLFLGSSETPATMSEHFATIDGHHRLYRLHRRMTALLPGDMPVPRGAHPPAQRASGQAAGATVVGDEVTTALAALARAYAPPAVLVSADRTVLHMFGDVHRLLRLRTGAPSFDLLQLLPDEVAPVVATLLHAATREKTPQRSHAVPLQAPDEAPLLRHVAVTPIMSEQDGRVTRLIVGFEAPSNPVAAADLSPLDPGALAEMGSQHFADLERELDLTRANLQDTIEDLSTVNEELQASNEELMASNEELQSTNEELQSVNEELHTVNAEYQSKIAELNALNADLESLTRSAGLPLLFLDGDLRVTRFTPEAAVLFRLREVDLGRPLTELSHDLDDLHLFSRLRTVRDTATPSRTEATDGNGRRWLVTILPHPGDLERGTRIVLSCIDVTSLHDAARLQSVLDALPECVAVLDRKGKIARVNESWLDFATANGGDPKELGVGADYLAVCRDGAVHESDPRVALEGIESVLARRKRQFSMVYPCHAPDAERWFLLNVGGLESGGCVVSHFRLTGWRDTMPHTDVGPAAAGQSGTMSRTASGTAKTGGVRDRL